MLSISPGRMSTPKPSPPPTTVAPGTVSAPVPYKQIRALYDNKTITVYQAYSAVIADAAVAEQRLNASPSFTVDSRMTWIKPSWAWMLYRSGYSYKDKGQERILALKMRHEDFLDLLRRGVLTTAHSERNLPVDHDPAGVDSGAQGNLDGGGDPSIASTASEKMSLNLAGDFTNKEQEQQNQGREWERKGRKPKRSSHRLRSDSSSVKVQWDPERSIRIERLDYRSIQIGIPGSLTRQWCEEMIVGIEDVTGKARELKRVLDSDTDKKITLEELVERGLVPVEREFEVPAEIRRALGMDLPGGEGEESGSTSETKRERGESD